MSLAFNIFVFVGTAASIASLLIGLWKFRRSFQVLNTLLVVALSVFSAYTFFRYQAEVGAQKQRAARREELHKEATTLFRSFASGSYYDPGTSRGIALAGIAFLERYQDLYPETYKTVRETILKDIHDAQVNSNTETERHTMEAAAHSLRQIIYAIGAPDTMQ